MRQSVEAAGIALVVVPVLAWLACGGSSVVAPSSRSQLTPVASTADWPASLPDSQGVDAQSILDLVGRIGRNEYGSVSSLLLVRHGQLIVEEYFAGHRRARTPFSP